MSETRDPYGSLQVTGSSRMMTLSSRILAMRLVAKEKAHLPILSGQLWALSLLSKYLGRTILKAPLILAVRTKEVAFLSLTHAFSILYTRHIIRSADNLRGRALNCYG